MVEGKNLYDWIYIQDVVDALIAISECGKPNKTYYVGHEELQTFECWVTQTRDIVAPGVELDFGAFSDGVPVNYSLLDRGALFRDTGFQCHADFKSSILRTAQWLRAQKEGKK